MKAMPKYQRRIRSTWIIFLLHTRSIFILNHCFLSSQQAHSQLVLEQCPIDEPMPKVLLFILLRASWLEKLSGQPLGFRPPVASFKSCMKVPFCRRNNFFLQQNFPSVIFPSETDWTLCLSL